MTQVRKTTGRMKTRKLCLVRSHGLAGTAIGRAVGFKARLLPRVAASRVAKRLRKAGLFITIDPVQVNLTAEQCAYLDRRYGARRP